MKAIKRAKKHNDVSVNNRQLPSLLTVREAAEMLRLHVGTLNNWRVSGAGPRFVRLGRHVRYRVSDLDSFLDEQTKRSTAQT